MAKVTLEFDSIEDQEDLFNALYGYKYKLAFWDIDQKLRDTVKYGKGIFGEEATDEDYKYAEKFREMINEALSEYKLDLD